MRQVVLPQAMRVVLPPLVGQYVLLIKDSSVVSAIGLTDLTRVGWLVVQRVPTACWSSPSSASAISSYAIR